MKKYGLLIISLLTIILLPFNASAAGSVSLSVSCNDVLVGQDTSCTVYATPTNGMTAAKGTISITGGAVQFVSANPSGLQGEVTSSQFNLYGNTITSRTALFTINLKGTSAGSATINVNLSYFGDGEFNDNNVYVSGQGRVNITAPTTTAAPTTRATTRGATQIPMTTQTVAPETTRPNILYLTGLTVDEYEVKEENGVYYVTTDSNREFVQIDATAPEGVNIVGTGRRNLAVGKNSVPIILRDEFGGTATISLIITRPDGGDANTLLKELSVVNYKLDFNPNTMEYTVTVPYNVKEVYVYAVAQSPDTTITGDGILRLSSKDNNAYVKVSYGDLASSLYTIHIKKSYMSLLPVILLTIGMIGGIGGALYLLSKLKQTQTQMSNNTIAQKADEQRSVKMAEPQMSLNGSSVSGVGARVVQPTQVQPANMEVNPVEDSPMADLPDEPVDIGQNTVTVQTKVVNTRPSTTPGMVAPKVVPVNNLVASSPNPQVKVVKKVVHPVNTGKTVQQVQVNTSNIQ